MLAQKVEYIDIRDLVLWTENPRDSIDPKANDQDIVDRAFTMNKHKWNLKKLAKEMGEHYDFSEIPTVVDHEGKKVVYDGNRRIILAKLKHGLVTIDGSEKIDLPDIPDKLPCNICLEDIAILNIYRKHYHTGSWEALERDIFVNKFMGGKETPFMLLDKYTGIISTNKAMAQRFVKDEVFSPDSLTKLGFSINKGKLYTKHPPNEAKFILEDISKKVEDKVISTRKKRGNILEVLSEKSLEIIENNKKKKVKELDKKAFITKNDGSGTPSHKKTRRTKPKRGELFGETLCLEAGEVNNLYRDINDLYLFYQNNKTALSHSFPAIIRLALRIICELAAGEKEQNMDKFVASNFDKAKQALTKDQKTTLSNQNVKKDTIAQLLHTGAHTYTNSKNIEQLHAMGIIIGSILTITYGKKGS